MICSVQILFFLLEIWIILVDNQIWVFFCVHLQFASNPSVHNLLHTTQLIMKFHSPKTNKWIFPFVLNLLFLQNWWYSHSLIFPCVAGFQKWLTKRCSSRWDGVIWRKVFNQMCLIWDQKELINLFHTTIVFCDIHLISKLMICYWL